jgi:hypothetical protein
MNKQQAETWANGLKRALKNYRQADAAVRKEVKEHEGDDPMSDQYKWLDGQRAITLNAVHLHLTHDKLLAVADFILRGDDGRLL